MKKADFSELRVTPRMSRHSEIMHRHEDGVSADQAEPEVPSRQTFIHQASKHFRKPVISRSKDTKDGGDTHDQVKVTRHEVRVVQRNVEHGLREERTADSTRDK